MNLVKRSLKVEGTKGGVRAFKEVRASVRASLLPVLDSLVGLWAPVSLFSSLVGSTGVLTRRLWRVIQDFGAIAKIWSWCCFSKQAGWHIGYEAFRIVKWSIYGITLGWTRWEDVQCEQKKVTYRSHVTLLHKRRAKSGKMYNWLFSLDWVQVIEPG